MSAQKRAAPSSFWTRLTKRLAPFCDLTAWVLLLASLVPLALIDLPMVKTLVQWSAFALALAGITVVLSRIVMPQIDLSEWVDQAREGNTAAGLVVFSVALFMGLVVLSLVIWAKA